MILEKHDMKLTASSEQVLQKIFDNIDSMQNLESI
jgi:hypothetical protein